MTTTASTLPLRCMRLQRVVRAISPDEPRFDRVLGMQLSHPRNQVTYVPATQTLTVRCPVTPRITWPKSTGTATTATLHQGRPLLSTYLSLIDDVTTWGLFEANVKNGQMGVSLSMVAQDFRRPLYLDGQQQQQPERQVDIVAQVQKIGRNVAFLNCTVQEAADKTNSNKNNILVQASHIKYLGSMGWLRDLSVSQKGFDLATWYYGVNQDSDAYFDNDDDNSNRDIPTVANVFETVEYDTQQKEARFATSNLVSNNYGTVHGGAHSTLVQLTAQEFIKNMNNNHHQVQWTLESIQMEYLAALPLVPTVQVKIDSSYFDYHYASRSSSPGSSAWVKVHVVNPQNGRISSTGLCQFVALPQ